MQWFHRLMGNRFSHEELIDEAGKIPAGSNGLLFLPYLKFGSPPTLRNNRKEPYWVWGLTPIMYRFTGPF